MGSINSLCQILELFSSSSDEAARAEAKTCLDYAESRQSKAKPNCKLKRECSELHDRFNLRFEPRQHPKDDGCYRKRGHPQLILFLTAGIYRTHL